MCVIVARTPARAIVALRRNHFGCRRRRAHSKVAVGAECVGNVRVTLAKKIKFA
jgi:hypothetical protein